MPKYTLYSKYMMYFIHADAATASIAIQTHLKHTLEQGIRVLWLIPGGSNIPTVSTVMQSLPESLTSQLTIMLTDERYGDVGHPDSNVTQLQHAGFNPKQASFLPVLTGNALEATSRAFADTARVQFSAHHVIFGQFGVGADGHIAGILPGTPAAQEQDIFAVGYRTDSFTRITLTFPALRHVTAAFALIYGDTKRIALLRLRDQKLPLETQPAQILKVIPQAYVYNDQLE